MVRRKRFRQPYRVDTGRYSTYPEPKVDDGGRILPARPGSILKVRVLESEGGEVVGRYRDYTVRARGASTPGSMVRVTVRGFQGMTIYGDVVD